MCLCLILRSSRWKGSHIGRGSQKLLEYDALVPRPWQSELMYVKQSAKSLNLHPWKALQEEVTRSVEKHWPSASHYWSWRSEPIEQSHFCSHASWSWWKCNIILIMVLHYHHLTFAWDSPFTWCDSPFFHFCDSPFLPSCDSLFLPFLCFALWNTISPSNLMAVTIILRFGNSPVMVVWEKRVFSFFPRGLCTAWHLALFQPLNSNWIISKELIFMKNSIS